MAARPSRAAAWDRAQKSDASCAEGEAGSRGIRKERFLLQQTAQDRWSGTPIARAVETNRNAASRGSRQWRHRRCRQIRSSHSVAYSLHHSLLLANDGHKKIGDAGRAHLAERGKLLAVPMVEQQDVAAESLALADRFERSRCCELIRMHCQLEVM